MSAVRSLGIYIHIPVCSSLCGYCDFYSVRQNEIDKSFWQKYLLRLKEEFKFKEACVNKKHALSSIYFGGGTPSLAPDWFINDIIGFLLQNISFKSRQIEISIEANPETISRDLIQRLFDFGINRLSIGIQSLNTEVLSRLERSTDLKQTLKALEYAASGPIHNWNADFIYGIPGQSNETLERDINQLTDFNPKHISAYALTMERNILGDKTISDKRQYTHQNFLWEFLPSRGYEQYEISNFSKKGYECIHNLSVWKYRPYLSLGTSGHSFFNDRRFRTISDIERYLSEPFCDILIEQSSLVIPDLFISILRLNKSQGMSLFNRLLSVEESRKLKALLKKFEKNNWVKFLNNGFKITREGLNFSNIMLEEVYRDL